MKKGVKDSDIKKLCGNQLSINEIHDRLLLMMSSFDRFCKKNNLRYYPAGGTLIGAIRHKGFIPWDDDVDIYMPREDYNKLISFEKINEKIDIVSRNMSKHYYHPFQHCNLSDKDTIIISNQLMLNTGKGLFVDIFPLDNVPDDIQVQKKFLSKIYNYCRICSYAVNAKRKCKTLKDVIIRMISAIVRHIDINKILNKIDNEAIKYNSISCKRWGPISRGGGERVFWEKTWTSNIIRTKFEDIEIDVPEGYDLILRHTFGDYMQLPPEDQRIGKHEIEVYWKNK